MPGWEGGRGGASGRKKKVHPEGLDYAGLLDRAGLWYTLQIKITHYSNIKFNYTNKITTRLQEIEEKIIK